MKTLFFALLILGFVFVNSAAIVRMFGVHPKNMFLRFGVLPDQVDRAIIPQPFDNKNMATPPPFTPLIRFG
ncbi:hypothetical protein QR680_003843 [Steinernema hermaphroditum]|uniref:Uncharacterized protein n=1 Tax=Steinernema hermaphroditum TaxID=289476 RepID=A0AA39LSS2_9BILA|nr:hypothetical protein QR680_003843 [Steinernema hermaphroditum]